MDEDALWSPRYKTLQKAQQFVRADPSLTLFQMLLRIVRNPLCEFFGVREKKVEIEGARLGQHISRCVQV